MKHVIYILFFLLGLAYNAKATSLEAYFHYAEFYSPEGPYIETYLSTIGNTATFVKTEEGFQAEIQITMLFKQNDSIKHFNKYNIKSPVVTDSLSSKPNFVDLQRIPIEEGVYHLEMIIMDKNRPTNVYTYYDTLDIFFPEDQLCFSGLQPVESISESEKENILTKTGINMVPYVSNFYPGNINKMIFYTEIYNSDVDPGEEFLLRYYIKDLKDNAPVKDIARFKRTKPAPIVPVLGQLNIEDLSSGNYHLIIETRNKDNDVLASVTYFFQRYKPIDKANFEDMEQYEMNSIFAGDITNHDTLQTFIRSLRPIANEQEKKFINKDMENTDLIYMQRFFATFWYERNPADPGGDWRTYKKQIHITDKLFSTRIKRGFETDRGRVYLKYGPPNDSYQSEHEPSAYPYEIWSYYKAGDQRNKKFVFYNPDLAGNDYHLLHSNVRGELQTPNWERYLNRRNTDLYNHNVLQSDDYWGKRAKEYWDSH
ncbi:MAG: GWxTD domain-containing protein [Bacteroidota bacterium]|nr:GWxTD domain-containing protein [Bacteroidota bacterium]